MSTKKFSEQLAEQPNKLFDAVIKKLNLPNDSALAQLLEIAPPIISKIRHKTLRLGSSVLVRLLEATDLHICDLHELTIKEIEDNVVNCQFKYHPNFLIDTLIKKLRLKNSMALSRVLNVGISDISKIRRHRLPVGPTILTRMHQESGLSIQNLLDLIGDKDSITKFTNEFHAKKRHKTNTK